MPSTSELTTALQVACEPFADDRLHHCQLRIADCEGNVCTLAGSALDQATLDGVLQRLTADLPQMTFRTDAVRVLRQDSPRTVVTTNVAGVYAQASFASELVTQVMTGWPLEALDEDGDWAFTRQADGYLGWVYRAYLGGPAENPATHLVTAPILPLRERPEDQALLLGRLGAGALVAIIGRQDRWRLVQLPDRRMGWVQVDGVRPLDEGPTDEETLRGRLAADALTFMGTPYRWGGSTGFGIDCSGFVRLLHWLNHISIPRDADMQFQAGEPVHPPFKPGDLFFFKSEGSRRTVTHVGMSLGSWKMIHASISRNGVYIDDVQQVIHLKATFVAARSFVP